MGGAGAPGVVAVAALAAVTVGAAGALGRRLWLAATGSAVRARLLADGGRGGRRHRPAPTWLRAGRGATTEARVTRATVPPPGGRPVPTRFRRALSAAGVEGDPSAWFERGLAAAVVTTGLATVVAGPAAGALVVAVVVAGTPITLHGLRHRGDQRLEASLPPLLDVTAAALRSGASLRQGLAAAGASGSGRLASELRAVVTAVDRGAPLVSELDRWVVRRPLPGLRLTVAALALGAEAGGARAQAVDGVAATLRDRAALRGEIQAQSAQARASAAVMTVVPVAVAIAAAASDPRIATVMLRTGPGVACLLTGLALDAVAVLWMLRLIRGAA